jgi:acetylornithine deacetylase/succinyl-diaminopimelate desuccinylase-like protein
MLPALVASDDPGVRALQSAHKAHTGHAAETRYGQGTFDAGGPCALGVPTVMYGVSGGIWPTGIDFVTISDVETEARVLAHLILSELA